MSKDRYFLSVNLAGEEIKREVSLEEYCKAERAAGFRPKCSSTDPQYWTTPATAGFTGGNMSGSIEYGDGED